MLSADFLPGTCSLGLATEWIEIELSGPTSAIVPCLGLATEWIEICAG